MNILLEDVARTKLCPRLATECHGSGCMAWKAEPGEQSKEYIDWPEHIERPRIDFENPLNIGVPHRDLAMKLHEMAVESLKPLIGTERGDTGLRIVRAIPQDVQLKRVTITLEGPARGGCVEMGARS